MFSLTTILSLTSVAHASQLIFESLPHPALWNRTCDGDHVIWPNSPFCPKTENATPTSAPPWTEEQSCMHTSDNTSLFCIYTSTTFANGRGISIFTTPAIAEHLAQTAAFIEPKVLDGFNVEVNSPFTVQPLPGRGFGVIMNRTVHRGDTMFSYNPVLIINRKLFELFGDDDLFPYQTQAINRLPASARDQFLALHGHFGGDKVNDIIHTNSFEVMLGPESGQDSHNIVLPETSRMNHDCRPNAHYYFDVDTLTHHTHAIRTIHSGEELTISYTDGTVSQADRQAAVKRSWGFDCSCSLCSQRDIFIRESDRRLQLIEELEKYLDDWSPKSPATPEMGEALVSLYEQERLHAPIAVGYTYAALAHNAVGNAHSAIKYASLALEANILNSGPDYEDVHAVREMMENPENHWSWKLRRKV